MAVAEGDGAKVVSSSRETTATHQNPLLHVASLAPRPYNPLDDRIVELHLHWGPDDSLGHSVQVGMWWRIASDQLESGKT